MNMERIITQGGLSLWGEKRPEVAVLPGWSNFYCRKPDDQQF